MAVVSAAFETGISLSAYIQFSCFIDMQNEDICKIMNKEPPSPVAHGLGTYRWLKEDIITLPLSISRGACSGFMEASVVNAGQTLVNFNINQKSVVRSFKFEKVHKHQLKVEVEGVTFSIDVQELGDEKNVRKFHMYT